jgi:hypothetical protein
LWNGIRGLRGSICSISSRGWNYFPFICIIVFQINFVPWRLRVKKKFKRFNMFNEFNRLEEFSVFGFFIHLSFLKSECSHSLHLFGKGSVKGLSCLGVFVPTKRSRGSICSMSSKGWKHSPFLAS